MFLSYKGPGSDLEILDLVKSITPIPASTVLTAVVRGCRALGLKRIVMASPFPEDQDERLVKFLAHYGIEVVAFRGLGCPNADVIWELAPATGYDLATALLSEHPEVDGIYMPCNKWRTVSVIERIEKDHGKPVVTNTQAWVWEALRLMNMREAHSRLRPAVERIQMIEPTSERAVKKPSLPSIGTRTRPLARTAAAFVSGARGSGR